MIKKAHKIEIIAYCYENDEQLRKQAPYWIGSEITQHIKRMENWMKNLINEVDERVIIKFETKVVK